MVLLREVQFDSQGQITSSHEREGVKVLPQLALMLQLDEKQNAGLCSISAIDLCIISKALCCLRLSICG